jgi:hypothetical protein
MVVELVYWEDSREEERDRGEDGERPGDRKKGRRGRRGVQQRLREGSLVARASRRWHGHVQEASTHLFPMTQRRRQSAFANIPLVLGSFPENFKTALVLYHLML